MGASHHLVSTVDDVAWLLNLRGSDVPFNPVFVAHLLIGPDGATLYIAPGKCSPELQQALAADGVQLAPYEEAPGALAALPAAALASRPMLQVVSLWACTLTRGPWAAMAQLQQSDCAHSKIGRAHV